MHWLLLKMRAWALVARCLEEPDPCPDEAFSDLYSKLSDPKNDEYSHFLKTADPSSLSYLIKRLKKNIIFLVSASVAALHLHCVEPMLRARRDYTREQKSGAERCLAAALQCLGVDMSLEGVLGKRTRFQTKDLAQVSVALTKSIFIYF